MLALACTLSAMQIAMAIELNEDLGSRFKFGTVLVYDLGSGFVILPTR